ncbi:MULTISPECIES: DUF2812 domain-containing protein [Bacillus]|uniref:DUF2812 domain-containing protein n=1 Tax=Bacillus TaxID=1386 RepID=UPI00030C72A2|nr:MULTISPECIES: DUF2812 domain-containing protein [Bacillus]
MRKVVRKIYMNFKKEEKWLNEMATNGLHLVDFSFGRYVFEEGVPGEYIYRIELLEQLAMHPQSQAYIQFMKESGVECIATYGRWVFFRKRACKGVFELFSKVSILMGYYKKVMSFVGILAGLNLLLALINIVNGLNSGMLSTLIYFSLLNLAVFILLFTLLVSYWRKYYVLKKDKELYE